MLNLLSLADVISITNALFGSLAVIFLISDVLCTSLRIHVSFSFILLALLADGLDGIVARRTRKSDIGEYLESMADMTSMIIAPAVFVYFMYADYIGTDYLRVIYLFIALVLFLSFGIIRLASFHIMKEEKYFVGLPASVSTIILPILAYFTVEFVYILPAVIIIGAAMASNLTFPKPGIRINGVATVLILLSIIFGRNFYGVAPWILLLAILAYAIGGPIYLKFLKKTR
jgi:CDP-diacylglycerol--serine O-phosphatidyltransferase